MAQANQAIAELEQAVDTLIVVNNDQLLKIIPADTPVEHAFKVADDVLRQVKTGNKLACFLVRGCPRVCPSGCVPVSYVCSPSLAQMEVGRGKKKKNVFQKNTLWVIRLTLSSKKLSVSS